MRFDPRVRSQIGAGVLIRPFGTDCRRETDMTEDQQIREAAMRLALQHDNDRSQSMPTLVRQAEIFEHYLRHGELPALRPGEMW